MILQGLFVSITLRSSNCCNYFRTGYLPFLYLKSLLHILLIQDVIICNDIGWWSSSNKSSYDINDIDVGIGKIVEGAGADNQVFPSHRASSSSFIIVVDAGRLP